MEEAGFSGLPSAKAPGVINSVRRSPQLPRRGSAGRALGAGVFLVFDFPLLFSVIAGAGLVPLVMGVRALPRHLGHPADR